MARPIFYIEIRNSWRSARPEQWRDFIEDTLHALQTGSPDPDFQALGKKVYGKRPSRVKLQSLGERRAFWAEDPHIHVRSPLGWMKTDWEYELAQVQPLCRDAAKPDILKHLRRSLEQPRA